MAIAIRVCWPVSAKTFVLRLSQMPNSASLRICSLCPSHLPCYRSTYMSLPSLCLQVSDIPFHQLSPLRGLHLFLPPEMNRALTYPWVYHLHPTPSPLCSPGLDITQVDARHFHLLVKKLQLDLSCVQFLMTTTELSTIFSMKPHVPGLKEMEKEGKGTVNWESVKVI